MPILEVKVLIRGNFHILRMLILRYRTSLEAKDDSLQLRDTKTNSQRTFSKLGDLSSAGSSHQNTSGQFVSNGDQGYNALTLRKSDISLDSTSTWNYPGPVISQEDDYYVIHWSSPTVLHQPLP